MESSFCKVKHPDKRNSKLCKLVLACHFVHDHQMFSPYGHLFVDCQILVTWLMGCAEFSQPSSLWVQAMLVTKLRALAAPQNDLVTRNPSHQIKASLVTCLSKKLTISWIYIITAIYYESCINYYIYIL